MNFRFLILILFLAPSGGSLLAQNPPLPSDWKFFQDLPVERAGFMKLPLPVETMNAARSNLEDLRVYNSRGEEVPFYLQAPAQISSRSVSIPRFTSRVEEARTIVEFETGTAEPLEFLDVQTPARDFIKPITIAGSNDGSDWQTLVQAQPIFRRGISSHLEIPLPRRAWKFLRVIAHDAREPAIPIQGFTLQTAPVDQNPPRALEARILERQEAGQDTRVTIDLGAANLYLARIEVTTPEPFFTRGVSVLTPRLRENEIVEENVAVGAISRIQVEGPASENRTIAINKQVPAQQLVLVFKNQDAPPLKVSGITAYWRPFTAGFYAQNAERHLVLTGNSRSAAPKYELNLIRDDLAKASLSDVKLGPLTPNPNYKEPAVLPGLAETGASIDVAGWKYRKAVQLSGDGPQQLELDLETLSFAASDLRDLRLVQNGAQLPYLIERTGALKELSPQWHPTNDPARPSVSQWRIVLPYAALPIKRVTAQIPNPLFQRNASLFEIGTATRDDARLIPLAHSTWTRKPEQTQSAFAIDIAQPLRGDLLLLEMDNGDNSPIAITNLKVYHPVTRLIFKAGNTAGIDLYFGNPDASAPRYDLAMVAEPLIKANKRTASLGKIEELKRGLNFSTNKAPVLFWLVLCVVVLGLFYVIARLLPAAKPQ